MAKVEARHLLLTYMSFKDGKSYLSTESYDLNMVILAKRLAALAKQVEIGEAGKVYRFVSLSLMR
jgi:hypothetical protein